ncbi:TlpA family protein disulfide reductase [Nocardioides sp. JQ2195]|uniref:TlpA family protein disulfide reductase n=1 Tax=Nocardioides sp. JQ2195 TaxID=2592334 RepID=UPI00143ED06F|nr:TlpA disulfide reductase family protein [Nocardioides sp. JQ2195]QIX28249.1 TlpA family protein disulfide reductase [Nocardioides sp. JQ2195]
MRRTLVAVVVALLALQGCDSITPPEVDKANKSDVDVDTPELRKLKDRTEVADCQPTQEGHVDGGLPDVTLPCLGGGKDVDVAGLRGPMVVNLWAVWCGPCRRELPIYQQFHEKHGDRVPVLGIDFQDTQPGAALDLIRETGVSYPQLADPQTDLSLKDPLPNIAGLPYVILIDEDGVVRDQRFEEIDDLAELEGLVSKHLGIDL